MKHLFTIVPKDGKGGEVAGVFLTHRTLVSGALDVDISVQWFTLFGSTLVSEH
jgi:hypothetical protein